MAEMSTPLERQCRQDEQEFSAALAANNAGQAAAILARHPPLESCPVGECWVCSVRECPNAEPLHFHHDGCPQCAEDDG